MADRLIDGRYRLLERHAVGGMATLWRARDERTGEVVALKRLHPYLMADPVARDRLVREAAALQAVDHPAIIRPREVIDDPDDPALVMDFAAGRSLQERLADEGAFAPEEAVAIAGTVADALAVAHQAGIVHRDVKPANILVEDSGAVHLVDFGIAILTETDETALTATRTMVGTLRYTAPERLTGAPASPRADVWALGAVLYEMLTGRSAVAADAAGMLSADGAAPPATNDLPPALAAVVRLAMSPDPADRYPDAGAFRDALSAAEAGVDPDARTAVIPLLPQVQPAPGVPAIQIGVAGAARSAGWGGSPVDRAAATFLGAVGALTLVAIVAIGIGGAVGAEQSPAPAVSGQEPAPATIDIVITPSPDGGKPSEHGRGKGGDRGKDHDNDD